MVLPRRSAPEMRWCDWQGTGNMHGCPNSLRGHKVTKPGHARGDRPGRRPSARSARLQRAQTRGHRREGVAQSRWPPRLPLYFSLPLSRVPTSEDHGCYLLILQVCAAQRRWRQKPGPPLCDTMSSFSSRLGMPKRGRGACVDARLGTTLLQTTATSIPS